MCVCVLSCFDSVNSPFSLHRVFRFNNKSKGIISFQGNILFTHFNEIGNPDPGGLTEENTKSTVGGVGGTAGTYTAPPANIALGSINTGQTALVTQPED